MFVSISLSYNNNLFVVIHMENYVLFVAVNLGLLSLANRMYFVTVVLGSYQKAPECD